MNGRGSPAGMRDEHQGRGDEDAVLGDELTIGREQQGVTGIEHQLRGNYERGEGTRQMHRQNRQRQTNEDAADEQDP